MENFTKTMSNYWAGYADGKHILSSSIITGKKKYILTSSNEAHLDLLHLHSHRKSRETKSGLYKMSIDKLLPPVPDKHYLRGFYDSCVSRNLDRHTIQITGFRDHFLIFEEAFKNVFHTSPVIKKYNTKSKSMKWKLYGLQVDLFLAAIFDAEVFNPDRWPVSYQVQFKTIKERVEIQRRERRARLKQIEAELHRKGKI